MASITSAGVGSGLDIEGLMTKLMTAERQPLTQLQLKEVNYKTQISAYGKLSSAISTLRSSLSPLDRSTDFKVFSTASTNEDVLTASASISAAPGQYAVSVTRTAEAHKLLAATAQADKDTATLGKSGDFMKIQVGDASSYFLVEYGGKTLEQIRDAINSASDNAGVTASVLGGDSGYQLVLTANDTGAVGFTQVSYVPFGFDDESGGAKTTLGANKYYADADTTIIRTGPDSMTIGATSIDIAGKTLNGIRDAINTAMGGTVTATVESSDEGYRLVLTSGSAITVDYATDPLSFGAVNQNRDGNPGVQAEDLQAVLSVDGVTATRDSNNVSDVVDGLTLNLVGGGASTLTVSRDSAAIVERVSNFVDAYNTFMDSLDTLNQSDLKSDATLRSIVAQVRNVLNSAASDQTFSYLTEVGVSFVLEDKELADGTATKVSRLELDDSKLSSKLSTNFADVSALFSDTEQGFGARLDSLLNNFVKTNGFIDTRIDGINSIVDRLNDQQENWDVRLALIEQRYRAQFTAMDALVGSMKATSDFLTQQLSSLSIGK